MRRWTTATAIGAVVAVTTMGAGTVAAQLDDSVTILHAIPGITVDLFVDGDVVIAGFDAGDTQDLTPFAGTTLENIQAQRAGSDEVVIGPIDSFAVPAQGNASVVVHLDTAGQPTITPFFNTEAPAEQGRGVLTVRHVAAAPPIAVTLSDEVVLDGIGNAQGGSVVLPAGEITDAWVTAGGERIAPLPTLQLEANSQLVVYVGGNVEQDILEFYVQVIAGGDVTTIPTPASREDAAGGNANDAGTSETAAEDAGADAAGRDAAPEAAGTADAGADDGAQEAAVQTDDDDSDDGTPQPEVVNTGAALGSSGDGNVALMVSGALFTVAVAAIMMRRRLLRSPDVALDSQTAPWGPPSLDR